MRHLTRTLLLGASLDAVRHDRLCCAGHAAPERICADRMMEFELSCLLDFLWERLPYIGEERREGHAINGLVMQRGNDSFLGVHLAFPSLSGLNQYVLQVAVGTCSLQ